MGVERRVLLLALYIAAQAVFLKLTIHPGSNGEILSIPGGAFQPLLYFGLGFFLLLSTRFRPLVRGLLDAARDHRWHRLLIAQGAAFACLIYTASKLLPSAFTDAYVPAPALSAWWLSLLAASTVATCLLSLGLIAPGRYWRTFARREMGTVLLACIFPLSHFLVYSLVVRSEDILSGPTIAVVRFLLDLAYNDVQADFQSKVIGTPQFDVIIDHLCSGYEGIGMITVFLIWYLHSFSKDVRYPAALMLFPLGALLIWLSNCLRIALLVAIGTSVSSTVAMNGFHANAGWIFFIAVAMGMAGLGRHSACFSRKPRARAALVDADSALVIPLLVMLAATLVSSAFSSEFAWLYPVRAMATGCAIVLLWKQVDLDAAPPAPYPVLAGALVFLLWLALVPPSADADRTFSEHLFSVPALWSAAWIIVRMTGSVIVIPIAEELAFRGYIPTFFAGGDQAGQAGAPLRWTPFVVSSLLFGALHGFWIAGAVAGAIYYLVRQRSGRLWDCIVAHMTTNLLLSGYVILSGHWSYW